MRRARSPHLSFFAPAFALSLAASLAWHPSAEANEGQWKPDQLPELAPELQAAGLELQAADLWNGEGDEKTGGLMRAAVNLSGCSAAFISADGLIATNHHCAYSAVQAQSVKLDKDLLGEGFLATTREEELDAIGKTVRVLRRVQDVSSRVLAAGATAPDPLSRAKATRLEQEKIVDACEDRDPLLRCHVAGFYSGSHYELFEYIELDDLRLVFVPPKSVGEYGGEVDNWMWPRHTGDFSLLRAYVDGKPYQPTMFLPVSAEGVSPGSFVAVMGYPGHTDRYLSAPETRRQLEQVLPHIVDVYGEWIAILERHGEQSVEVLNKIASVKKGLANRHKNARGMIDGITHMKLLATREAEHERLMSKAKEQGADAMRALDTMTELAEQARVVHERDFLLRNSGRVSRTLATAIDLVRRARESKKPDLERVGTYRDRNEKRLEDRLEGRVRDYDAAVEVDVLESILLRAKALSGDTRIAAYEPLLAGGDAKAAARSLVDATHMHEQASVDALFDAPSLGKIQKAAKSDPVLELALALAEEIEASEEESRERGGRALEAGPIYFELLKGVRKGPIYPDANGTLRFSFAQVTGYEKWDGAKQSPQTKLAGAVAKHTGEEPFDLPASVRDKAAGGADTYWAEPTLEDVPVCFLSNADTTGGNSGSPVVDGKGRFVGLNFDRVWENIAGDFGYNKSHSRNITVDVRYLLWVLDEVYGAQALLDEMGVGEFATAPARPGAKGSTEAAAPAPTDAGETTKEEPSSKAASVTPGGCACGIDSGSKSMGIAWWLGFVGLLFGRRRFFTLASDRGPG